MNEQKHHAAAGFAALTGDIVHTMQAYFDRELVCLYANAPFASLYGMRAEQIEGKAKLPGLTGNDYKFFEKHVPQVLAGKAQRFEFSWVDPSGFDMRYAHVQLTPHIVSGNTLGFVLEADDITPTKQLEREFQAKNDVFIKQNERLINFANIVTHNLSNYAGNLGIMLDFYSTETDEAEKQTLFDQLRDMSSSFSGSMKALGEIVSVKNTGYLPMQKLNMYEYVVKAAESLQPLINSTDTVIKNNVGREVYVEAIPAYMESIVYNFLSNTIKYRHRERKPEVELSSMVVGNEAVLTIKDNGIGIDLERHRSKLYGLYQTFTNNPEASGVGLFITKYQVDVMGGFIGVESEVGKGTEFRVYLKKAPDTAYPNS